MELRIGKAINTDDLSQILTIRSKGCRGHVKDPNKMGHIIKPLGYAIRTERFKCKKIRAQAGAAS